MKILSFAHSGNDKSRHQASLPAGFIAAIVAVGVVRAIIKKVYLNGSYDRQYISTNLPGSNHTNNVFSLGVSYSY